MKLRLLLLYCLLAVYSSGGHFVHCSSSDQAGALVFINLPFSNLTQGTMLHTFQNSGNNEIIHQEDCPRDIFTLSNNSVFIASRTISLEQNTFNPICIQDPRSGAEFLSIKTYKCFVVHNTIEGILLFINIEPSFIPTRLMFSRAFYSAKVVEGTENSSISILTSDFTANTQPERSLLLIPQYHVTGNLSHLFTVVVQQDGCFTYPLIQVIGTLYREIVSYYELTLEAHGSNVSASTVIGITVLDRNNHSPEFTGLIEPSQLRIQSSILPGTELFQFHAADMDVGLNGEIHFFILNTSTPFTIHPLTGMVYNYRSCDLHISTEFNLQVMAQDQGDPTLSTSTVLTIFIDSAYTTPPHISIHSLGESTSEERVTISEGARVGEVVATVNSTFSRLHLMNVGPCECFNLSGSTSVSDRFISSLMVADSLDFESSNGRYQITLTAQDSSVPQHLQLWVEVYDENEAPFFSRTSYEIRVMEGTPNGSIVYRIEATDNDSGENGTLVYSLTDPLGLFEIDAQFGLVYTTAELYNESLGIHQVTIQAEDGGGLNTTVILEVTIEDLNNHPPIFTRSSTDQTITITENYSPNRYIFKFVALDEDSGCNGAVEYAIVHASPEDAFRLDPISGLLYPFNDTSLDYESFHAGLVVIRAMDLGKTVRFSVETTFRVLLTNVDDETPVIDPIQCPCFIMENSPNSKCPPLSAHDLDSTNLIFNITRGNLTLFQIDSTTGVVSIVRPLDREEKASHQLEITVSDGSHISLPAILNVTVVDVNDEFPVYNENSITITIPQDLSPGDLAADLSANNSDAGYNALTIYSLSRSTVTFNLDPHSGLLYTKMELSGTEYELTVNAQDQLRPGTTTSLNVRISVSGLKNNPPKFALSTDHRTISDSLPVGSTVAQITAIDSDSGMLVYSIIEGSNHSGLFNLQENGQLMLANSVRGLSGNIYTLNISASDSALRTFQLVTITVYSNSMFELLYNPSVSVCHYTGSITESSDNPTNVTTLNLTQDLQTIQYTIMNNGESSNAFRIRGNQLVTEGGFGSVFNNKEAVFLTVVARYGSNFHLCSVTVAINDINNNPPVFSKTSYSFQLYNNTPVSSFLYTISASDADSGTNARIVYNITNTNQFMIDANTGVISLASGNLDQPTYNITVTATDPDFLPLTSATATVIAVVVKVPNHRPVFSTVSSPIAVTESTAGSVVRLVISDGDDDDTMQGTNFFCIASGNYHSAFHILRDGGDLRVNDILDYESSPPELNLTIMAYDNSLNPLFSTIVVTVLLQDKNEPPSFSAPVYYASILEQEVSGIFVTNVTATDRDANINGNIRYSIQGNVPFSVNPESGSVTTMGTLNRENQEMIVFNVTASDSGTPPTSSMAEVRVILLDNNDEVPNFEISMNRVVIEEDVEIGHEIVKIAATDRDGGINGLLQYRILRGDDSRQFVLDPWTGSLKVARSFDFEADPTMFILSIQARDLGKPSYSSNTYLLTVEVTDSNDHFPVFSSPEYQCDILEGSDSFSSICQVNAIDADRTGYRITYSFINTLPVPFRIEESSGGIIPTTNIPAQDRAASPKYILQVQATDSDLRHRRTSTAIVIVNIIDSNGVPQFESAQTYYFHEGIPANSLLFFAHAHEMDTNSNYSTVTYGILRASTNDLIWLERLSGAVFLNSSADYEVPQINITIVGTNTNTESFTNSLNVYTINIVDINENSLPPVFDPVYNPSVISLDRTLPPGSNVISVNASDPEGQTVWYDITGGSGLGFFQIAPNSGEVTIAFPLTSVGNSQLTIEIRAIDSLETPLPSWHKLTVSLSPSISPKPHFMRPVFQANPSENARGIISAVFTEVYDPTTSYAITNGNDDQIFTIDPQTGAISTGVVDREQKSIYNITVSASRPGVNGTSLTLLVVELEDANDFRPTFPNIPFDFSVFENFPVNETLARIFAVDEDIGENGRLFYSLSSVPNDSPFAITTNTGDLYLTRTLDRLEVTVYSITVEVMDAVSQSSVTFGITITPPAQSNTAFPTIPSPISITISENTPPGTWVTRVNITNSHSINNTLIYRIVESPPSVTVLPNTGDVYITGALDFEAQERLTFTLEVLDGVDRIPASTRLTIMLADENDNRPTFQSHFYSFSINEGNLIANMILGNVLATDQDMNNVLAYSIVDSQYPSSMSLFTVRGDGTISLSSQLNDIDREELPVHTLTIAVTDDGTPPLMDFTTVTITITDFDDHVPRFYPNNTSTFLAEDSPLGEVIYTVKAFDPDKGTNADISYQLITMNSPFSLNSTSGEVKLSAPLDFETQSVYSVYVRAFNPNNPSQPPSDSYLDLTVVLIDVLDSAPVLVSPPSASIQENYPAYSMVTRIQATSSSRPVYFSIVDGNSEGNFLVEALTGTVRTTTPLDREEMDSYQLTIQGSFGAGFESNISILVGVSDTNDEKPQFSSPFLSIQIPEHSRTMFPLGRLDVVDPDEGTNGMISLFVIADSFAATVFTIERSGNIMLNANQDLDRESGFSELIFTVYAIDSGIPMQYSSAQIHIEIIDVNDPPIFQEDDYTFVLSIPSLLGPSSFVVEAVDKDQGTNGDLVYNITGGNGSDIFSVNSSTGNINVVNNYMLRDQYLLILTATDGQGVTASTNIHILVRSCQFRNLTFDLSSQFISVSVPENVTNSVIVSSDHLEVIDLNLQNNMSPSVEFSLPLANPLFYINNQTGEVYVVSVDREVQPVHYLVIQATDTSDPTRIAQAQVMVTVLDINDNSPLFDRPTYRGDFTEEEVPRLQVNVTDRDEGPNGMVTYSLISDPSNLFTIESTTGIISLPSATGHGMRFDLRVRATDMGSPPLSSEVPVVINIVNSMAPRFSQNFYSVVIPENTSSNSLVGNVSLIILESRPISLRIVQNDTSLPFVLSNNGSITLVDPGVDYETQRDYNLSLRAQDTSNGLSGFAVFRIQVTDSNDNSPVFDSGFYTKLVMENATRMTKILQLNATDQDSLQNAAISYRLSNGFSGQFSIDSSTGSIYLSRELDFESVTSYEFRVLAEDSGSPSLTGTAVVVINVGNVNDNPPIFRQEVYNTFIRDSDQPGPTNLFVSAVDQDNLEDLSYYIVPGLDSDKFTISRNGRVNLNTSNPMEASYTLNVSAYDGVFFGYATVRISVEGVNDNTPMFNQPIYRTSLLENPNPGVFVVQVNATDPDRGSNGRVFYSLQITESRFAINSTTGVITTATSSSTSLDREKTATIAIPVTATDGGSLSALAQVVITLMDVNDNAPSFSRLMYFGTAVNQVAAETEVLTVSATDPDIGENSTLIYSVFGQYDQLIFTVDSMTGIVTNFVPPDIEVASHYEFMVTVRDNGNPSLNSTTAARVSIVITDGSPRPSFEMQTYNITILENVTYSTSVLQLRYSANTTTLCLVTSQIELFGHNNAPFEVVGDSIIVVSSRSNPLLVTTYEFTVGSECLMSSSLSLTNINATIIINVEDVNDPPEFMNNFYFGTVKENMTIGTPVQISTPIVATDPDSGDNGMIRYRILDNRDVFNITSFVASISTVTLLDYESGNNVYLLTIEAHDVSDSPRSATAIVRITVTDINDNPPIFNQTFFSVSVLENVTEEYLIFNTSAYVMDQDTNSMHMYSIDGSFFSIGTRNGEVRLLNTSTLDREIQSNYTAEIVVSDGIYNVSTNVIVIVLDANDKGPVFTNPMYEVTIQENYPSDRIFFQVNATDEDEGENAIIVYEQVTSSLTNTVSINNSTGEISFLAPPDFEIAPQLSLNIRATDIFGKFTSFATIVVRLTDENDNTPMFRASNYTGRISENLPPGSNVIIDQEDRVEAIDPDFRENGTVTYSIMDQDAAYFSISNGNIASRMPFDRETNSSFEIIVVATDMGTPPKSSIVPVLIHISDQNDNDPIFPTASYTINVSESVMVGTVVFTVRAKDADSGSNGEIRYYFIDGPNKEDFSVNNVDGSANISICCRMLDHEDIPRRQYNLTLTAVDYGLRMGTTLLLINVTDSNEHDPEFAEDIYMRSLPENVTINTTIVTVTATDRDASDQQELFYSIRNRGNNFEIDINEHTGEVFVASQLNYEIRQSYILTVQVEDEMNSVGDTTIVNITVTNVNDNAPRFYPHNFTYHVQENNSPGITLVDLEASDLDSNNASISYHIETGNVGNSFDIRGLTGEIIVLNPLDRETLDTYNLTITARDNDSPPLTGSTTIIVVVTDVNDNSPTGGHQDIFLYLFKGQVAMISLGEVYVNDSDIINDHRYQVLSSNGTDNIRVQNNGSIRVSSSTPQIGTYSYTVRVSDSDNAPVNTTISAWIRDVSEDTLSNSFKMEFDGIFPQDFVDNHLRVFLISSKMLVDRELSGDVDIQVLNIQPSGTPSARRTSMTIVALNHTDGLYVAPLRIQHTLHVHRRQLEGDLGLKISTESVDRCFTERCAIGNNCINKYNDSIGNMALGSQSLTYLGIVISHTFGCVSTSPCGEISCPEPSYCVTKRSREGNSVAECLDDCSSNPCRNGGECLEQNPGYYCQCLEGYDGRNCELTVASFSGDSYAIFPALESRSSGSLSFEFKTNSESNALLAYSGRFDSKANDYMYVQLINTSACLEMSHGGNSERICAKSWQSLGDERWNFLSIRYNYTVSHDDYTCHS